MHNYKALKSASKASVQKVKVVDDPAVEAVAEVKDDDGVITTHSVNAQAERSHEELQVVRKCYDPNTGEAQDDLVTTYRLSQIENEILYCKSDIAKIQAKQDDLEQLEKDLKAL